MEDVDLHFVGGELDERVGQSLDGAVDVALDDDVELAEVADGTAAADVLEGEHLGCAQTLFASELLALVGYLACLLLRLHDVECVAGGRSAVETEDEGGHGRTGLPDALVTLVEHGLDLAEVVAGQDDVAHAERTVLHQDVGHVAAAFVERRLYDGAHGAACGVGAEFEHLGFEKHFLHQFLHTDALLGGDVLALVLAAPVLDEVVHGGELFLDFVRICVGLVYLVDGKDDGHAGSRSMVDGLDGLRHDAVVGGHDDDDDVGHLGAACTHGGERFVTRGVEEGDVTSVGELDVVRADVLGDAAGLACDDVGLADVVKERGFTVVDVAHDGHDGRTADEVFLAVLFLMDGVGHLGGDEFGGESEFLGHDVDGLGVKALVDGHHHADVHTGGDDAVHGHVHHHGQFVGRHEFGDFQYAAFGFFGLHVLALAVGIGLALLLAPAYAFLEALVLRCEACEGLLHLLLYVFFVHFWSDGLTLWLALTVAAAVAPTVAAFASSSVVTATAVVATVVAASVVGAFAITALTAAIALVGASGVACSAAYLLDVDLLLAGYAAALLAVGVAALSGLSGTLAAAVVLTLLLGTGILVEGVEVNLAYDIDGRRRTAALEGEDFLFARRCRGLSLGSFGSFGCGFGLRSLGGFRRGLLHCGRRRPGSLGSRSLGCFGGLGCGFLHCGRRRLGCFGSRSFGCFGSLGSSFCLRCLGGFGSGLGSFGRGLCLRCLGSLGSGLCLGRFGTAHYGIAIDIEFEFAEYARSTGRIGRLIFSLRGCGRLDTALLPLGRNLCRTLLEVLVALEFAHQQIHDVLFNTGVGTLFNIYVALAKKLYHRVYRDIEVFRYFAYFRFRHWVFFVFLES